MRPRAPWHSIHAYDLAVVGPGGRRADVAGVGNGLGVREAMYSVYFTCIADRMAILLADDAAIVMLYSLTAAVYVGRGHH